VSTEGTEKNSEVERHAFGFSWRESKCVTLGEFSCESPSVRTYTLFETDDFESILKVIMYSFFIMKVS
jgi:hypothetical protein